MSPLVTRTVTVTRTQRRVIGELARDGATNPMIAHRLGMAENTVKTHMKAVLAAAGVSNRTALVCALLRGEVRLRTVTLRRSVEEGEAA